MDVEMTDVVATVVSITNVPMNDHNPPPISTMDNNGVNTVGNGFGRDNSMNYVQ